MISYTVTSACRVPHDQALNFLADGHKLGGWALGAFQTQETSPGVFAGRGLDTGELVYVRLEPDPDRGIVVYFVGVDPAELTPWIWAIVQPAERLGGAVGESVVSLIAWRPEGMSDDGWNVVCREHDIEIHFIKAQMERHASS